VSELNKTGTKGILSKKFVCGKPQVLLEGARFRSAWEQYRSLFYIVYDPDGGGGRYECRLWSNCGNASGWPSSSYSV
jgi:hypothetical protein